MSELVQSSFDQISEGILEAGESPQKTVLLESTIANLNNNHKNAEGIVFDGGNCSENRCVVNADVTNTVFNRESLNEDLTFKKSDEYYDLIDTVSDEFENAFGKGSQVSLYRAGNRVVMDVRTPEFFRSVSSNDEY
jgi:hypothetical protein